MLTVLALGSFCSAALPTLPSGQSGSVGGVTLHEQAELLPDSAPSCLGWSVAVDGDTTISGALHDSTLGQWSGAAYVFVRIGAVWRSEAKLIASDGNALDFFGCSVELAADTAFVGATDDDNGSVYVFGRNAGQWSQLQKIEATDGTGDAAFGAVIRCQDGELFVGAPSDEGGPAMQQDQGGVYVFGLSGSTWVQRQKLVATDAAPGDAFGAALDVDGDTLIVAAVGDDDVASDAGSAYVFERVGSQWIEAQKLVASDGESNDLLGIDVGIQGDFAAVGSRANAVYVYRRQVGTWSHDTTLSYPTVFDFGRELSYRGDLLLVGAPEDATHGNVAGLAFVFRRVGSNWLPVSTLVSSDIAEGDVLGRSVALSGSRAVVGAFLDDTGGANAGAVYVFDSGAPSSYCTAKTNSMGCVPFVATSGVPSVTATGLFEIRAHSVLRDEPGIILYGFNKANFNFHGGKLCIKAPMFRLLPPKAAKATGQPPCTGVLRRNFQNHLQSGANPALSVGQTVRVQWLLRDPADPLGFGDGLTDAVQFTVGP